MCNTAFCTAFKIYWRSIFLVIYPLLLLPIFLINNEGSDAPAFRCLFVILLMAGYWVTEALPLAVTALLPMVLFPVMGILDSAKTSLCYLKETNMMFVGGLIIAIAMEHCNLHRRIALKVILLMGCSLRKLNFGLVSVTTFLSMWISNTGATAMMCPVIEATLMELESQGIGAVYEVDQPIEEVGVKDPDAENRRPTKTTVCYFLSAAYSASIGGTGTLVGSGTNLTFKGIYETTFPNSPEGIDFTTWMYLNVPIVIITTLVTWVWLQILFMGLFRPKSEDSKRIQVGAQGEAIVRGVIKEKMIEMGPITFHETCVAICFIVAVILWVFRRPQFIPGWAEMISETKIMDSTAAMFVVVILFMLPAKPDFVHIFSKDKERRPRAPSPALLTWKVIHQKLPWALVFLLGGGFALAEGCNNSGMSKLVANALNVAKTLPKYIIMFLAALSASIFTEFTSNVGVANVILSVLGEMAKVARWHPILIMMPAAIACSHAFCFPVGTPPNAIVSAACNLPTKEMFKAGLGVSVIALLALCAVFPFLGDALYDLDTFPKWAED